MVILNGFGNCYLCTCRWGWPSRQKVPKNAIQQAQVDFLRAWLDSHSSASPREKDDREFCMRLNIRQVLAAPNKIRAVLQLFLWHPFKACCM